MEIRHKRSLMYSWWQLATSVQWYGMHLGQSLCTEYKVLMSESGTVHHSMYTLHYAKELLIQYSRESSIIHTTKLDDFMVKSYVRSASLSSHGCSTHPQCTRWPLYALLSIPYMQWYHSLWFTKGEGVWRILVVVRGQGQGSYCYCRLVAAQSLMCFYGEVLSLCVNVICTRVM